jgi:hypothetical protein
LDDYFYIYLNGVQKVQNSGENTSGTIEFSLQVNDKIRIEYVKNSRSYEHTDTCTFVINKYVTETKTTNNIARKIKKAYIGIGGKARPFWAKELTYYGTITPLSKARRYLSATATDNYALFAGGTDGSSTTYSTVDAYNPQLTRIDAPSLTGSRAYLTGVTHGDYMLFTGGVEAPTVVDVYNKSLTKV